MFTYLPLEEKQRNVDATNNLFFPLQIAKTHVFGNKEYILISFYRNIKCSVRVYATLGSFVNSVSG